MLLLFNLHIQSIFGLLHPFIISFILFFSKPVSLNDGNYGLLKDPNSQPLLIELWDSNCKTTCQNIEHTLDSILKKDFSNKIIFAEVNCQENPNLCSSLTTKKNYPQIIWVDQDTKQKFLFNEDFSNQNIKNFIQTQLSYPFIFIKDKNKLSNIKNKQKDVSIFTFFYKSKHETDDKFINVKKAAKNIIKNNKCTFYAVEDKKFKLSAIREKDTETFYHGDWSQDSLYLFIKRRLYPALIELNSKTVNILKSSQRLSLVAFLDPDIYLTDWKHLAQEVESDFQFSYVVYSPKNYFARMAEINSANLPQVILYDAKNQRWILYKNDLTDTGLTKWINQLDLNNAYWKRSKSSFLTNIGIHFTSFISNGGPLFYLFLLVLIGVIAFIIKVINESFKKRPKYKRGSDRAYEAL